MREILFKAKELSHNSWVEGYYVKMVDCMGAVHFLYHCAENPDDNNCRHEIDKRTISQFTGVYIKGKRVFENDIICNKLKDDDGTVAKEFFLVKYDEETSGFIFFNQIYPYDKMPVHDYEYSSIAGNIFDNAELLKK